MEDNTMWRMIATSVMWVALGIVSVMGIIFSSNLGDDAALIIGLPLSLALIGTIAIWLGPAIVEVQREKIRAQNGLGVPDMTEKAKRGGLDKYSLLMQMMDEDEREAFKTALKQRMLDDARITDDGEINVDMAYFEDDERHLRR